MTFFRTNQFQKSIPSLRYGNNRPNYWVDTLREYVRHSKLLLNRSMFDCYTIFALMINWPEFINIEYQSTFGILSTFNSIHVPTIDMFHWIPFVIQWQLLCILWIIKGNCCIVSFLNWLKQILCHLETFFHYWYSLKL